jgi:hypothetical protein
MIRACVRYQLLNSFLGMVFKTVFYEIHIKIPYSCDDVYYNKIDVIYDMIKSGQAYQGICLERQKIRLV